MIRSRNRARGWKSSGGSDVIISRNAINLFGLGHSTGNALNTSTGVTVNYAGTFLNQSGAPITIGSLVLSGWYLTSAGTANCGNDVPCTANIEYPVGVTTTNMLASGNTTITIPNGTDIVTDQVTLTTPIPAGATFKVNISQTITAGLKYLTNNGFNGIRTTALRSTLKKEMVFAIGDSIMTNNNGAVTTAATNAGCPSIQMSISGTTAQTYGASSASNFTKQVNLAVRLGATRFICNFSTNDLTAGRTYTQILTDLGAMKTLANASNILFTQATMLPRTSSPAVTPSSLTSSGNEMYAVVPDASKFTVGWPYTISGVTQTEYNNTFFVKAIVGSTITFYFEGSATPTATGSPSIIPQQGYSNAAYQTPNTGYEAGGSSQRALFNAAVRTGSFDGFLEWGDACEPSRDAGRWLVGGESSSLLAPVLCTVTSGINNLRFNSTWSNNSGTVTGGRAQWVTGANIGQCRSNNGNTNGDVTLNGPALGTNPATSETLYLSGGSITATDDGTHPRVATGTPTLRGGQQLIVIPTQAYITALLA